MQTLLISGIEQGLIWAILVIGVYISFRILDFADLSIEGTFPLGASICALLIYYNVNPFIATFIAIIGGMLAGMITGLLHTKLKIPAILSGIITMTGLYSINLVIMGFTSETAPILASCRIDKSVYTIGSDLFLKMFDLSKKYASMISVIVISGLFLLLISLLIYWLFGTEIGMDVRATGTNANMARAQGINTNKMITLGLMFSNGLIALSGALFAQDFTASNVDSGRGAIVIGLAAIIIGEIIFGKRSFKRSLISIIVGAIIFFLIKALAIYLHVDHFLNLLTAIIIAFILALPLITPKFKTKEHW